MAGGDSQGRVKRLRIGAALMGVAAVLLLLSGVLLGSAFQYVAAAMLGVSCLANLWAASGQAQ